MYVDCRCMSFLYDNISEIENLFPNIILVLHVPVYSNMDDLLITEIMGRDSSSSSEPSYSRSRRDKKSKKDRKRSRSRSRDRRRRRKEKRHRRYSSESSDTGECFINF